MDYKRIIVGCISFLAFLPQYANALSVDFAPGTPVIEALRALSFRAGKDIIINGELNGTVTLHFENTTFEDVLRYMSVTNGFSYDIQGDAVLVGPQKVLNAVETYKLRYADPEVVAKQLEVFSSADGGKVVANKNTRELMVSGSSGVLQKIRREIAKVDVAQQQVSIKAEVIEVNHAKLRDMGFAWESLPWGHITGTPHDGFQFTITGKHEENRGIGKVLARPTITTFDGQSAKIMMGDKVPIFTTTGDTSGSGDSITINNTMTVEYKDVGVMLEVEPYINDLEKEIVSIRIKPSVSTITEWQEVKNNRAPQISERSAETTLRVKSGETIILGGLLKDEEIKTLKSIPLLSKIPILGELFKSRSLTKKASEVIIAITPTIVKDEQGRPKVETQRTTPKLRQEMNKLKGEESEYNEQNADKTLSLNEKKRLQKEIARLKKEAAKKDAANRKLDKELQRNNRLLQQILDEKQGK